MGARFVALAGALALTACGIGASAYPDFTRTPPFRLEGVRTPISGGPSQHVVIYRDSAKLRVETLTPRGRTIIVYDQGTNDAYALASVPPPPIPGATSTTATTTVTTLPIAPPPNAPGLAVRVADAQAPQPLETPWAALTKASATNMGGCNVAGQQGVLWRATATALAVDERVACITPDGIVLRERDQGKTIFEATRLDRGHPDPSLFGVPASYQRQNPAAVAETTQTATTVVANTGPAG